MWTTATESWLSAGRRRRAQQVLLGDDLRMARPYSISLAEFKETSVHVVGAAGYGKSYFLRNLIDQFVRLGQPFGVIDPHQELVRYANWRLMEAGVRPQKIVLLDPSHGSFSLGFNPLRCGVEDPGEASSLVLDAFLKSWGASSFDETPRLEGMLRNIVRLLIAGNLTLLEAFDLLNVDNLGLRRALRERVDDRLVRQDFEEFEKLPRTEKIALVESSRNRIRRILHAVPVRRMLAETERPLDLREVLDRGQHLLVNVGAVSAPETQRLIGALLMNGILHTGRQRDSRNRRDFFLICDEFGDFATPDFAKSLDQLRKFGIHLVLAHQRLRQIEREDSDVMSAVMTNAKIKVVFGGLERPEAERMSRELFTGQVRGNRVKHIGRQTKFRPVMGTFVVETESQSESESESEASSRGRAEAVGETEAETSSGWYDTGGGTVPIGDRVLRGESRNRSQSWGRSESDSVGHSSSVTTGHSRSVVPVTRHKEFSEETSRQFWTPEEEWERLVSVVHGLPKREAIIRVYSEPAVHVRTPFIRGERVDGRLRNFETTVLRRSPYARSVARVEAQIAARQERITKLVTESEEEGRPFNVRSFRE